MKAATMIRRILEHSNAKEAMRIKRLVFLIAPMVLVAVSRYSVIDRAANRQKGLIFK